MKKESVMLIGPRGSGKSEIGYELSNLMKATFIDLEFKIQQDANMSIDAIVRERTLEGFRELESNALYRLLYAHSGKLLVVATGAGTISHSDNERLRGNNVVMLHETGTVYYLLPFEIWGKRELKKNAHILTERVNNTPLMQNTHSSFAGRISYEESMLQLRQHDSHYRKKPNVPFYTAEMTPREAAQRLFELHSKQ